MKNSTNTFKLPPMKLVWDEVEKRVHFVPQTPEDIIETQALNKRLNDLIKEKRVK